MKKFGKRALALFLAALLLVSPECAQAQQFPAVSQKGASGYAELSAYSLYLRVGKSKTITCKGTTGTMKWKSSKKSVATVSQSGVVKAKKAGKAVITVSGGNLLGSMKCTVYVSKKLTQKQAKKKLLALKETYPEGMSWTNENQSYFWEAASCQCYGCIAFAGVVSDKVFGKYAPVKTHQNFDKIKVGDHVRIGDYHSVIVLKKDGDTLTVAEGNYNSSVHWGRTITKSELAESGFSVDTRY